MNQEDAEKGGALLRRTPLLDTIRAERPTRRDLRERFDLARTTAYRTTVDLEERDLVEPADEGYRLTPRGVGVAEAGKRYVESLETVERLHPLFDFVDHPLLHRSLHLFDDADVLTPDPDEPFRLTDWLVGQTAEADYYRSIDALMGTAQQFEIIVERAEAGADMEAVFTRQRLSGWADAAAEKVASVLRFPNCNAFVGDDLPFPLKIFDETVVVVGVEEETGLPGACVATKRADTRDWAEAVYRRCRQAADPVDVADLVA